MNKIENKMTFKELLRFALPSIIMMIFLSSYTIIDGFFVSSFVGSDALAALNIVYPISGLFFAISIMFSSGGTALIGKFKGEGDMKKANSALSLISYVAVFLATAFGIIMLIFLNPILHFLGADASTLGYSREYMIIILITAPICMMQILAHSFFVLDSRPKLGLILTVFSGLSNILLDYLFMGPLNMGIGGAALATSIGYAVTGLGGLFYFIFNKKGLRLGKTRLNFRWLYASCLNGSSEMVTNLSSAIVTLLFNIFMMHFVGNKGITAITVILYAQFLMNSFFMGYSMGVAPVFSYHFGAGHSDYIKGIRNKSYIFIVISALIIFTVSMSTANITSTLFSNGDTEIKDLILRGTYLFSFCYLFAGLNIFNSSMFTALNDGVTSALISFLRTLVFIVLGMFTLAYFLKVDGIFLAIPFAELLTILVTITFYHHQYKKLDNIMNNVS